MPNRKRESSGSGLTVVAGRGEDLLARMDAQAPQLAFTMADDQVLDIARLLGQLVNVVHFGSNQDLVLYSKR